MICGPPIAAGSYIAATEAAKADPSVRRNNLEGGDCDEHLKAAFEAVRTGSFCRHPVDRR